MEKRNERWKTIKLERVGEKDIQVRHHVSAGLRIMDLGEIFL